MIAHQAHPIGLAILVWIMLVWAVPARAAVVVMVRPANPPPVMVETLVRLNGELMSVGFETEVVDGPAEDGIGGRESRAWLEQLAGERGADAVVAIVGDAAPNSVEVWVVDKVTGKSVVRRVPFEASAEHAPETLAIRALELLRSSFLEIDLAARERPGEPVAAPPAAVVRFVEMEKLALRPERFGIGVGGAAVLGAGGVGLAILPTARYSSFVMHIAVAGFGTRPTVANAVGSAQVAQAYGILGGGYRLRVGRQIRPFLALSAGALHTSVEGRADPPNQGRYADQWSLLADGELGAWLPLRDRFYLVVAVHAQVAEPYLAIRFADTTVANLGLPNLLVTLTVGAWL